MHAMSHSQTARLKRRLLQGYVIEIKVEHIMLCKYECISVCENLTAIISPRPCFNEKWFYNRETIELWTTPNVLHTPSSFYATQWNN